MHYKCILRRDVNCIQMKQERQIRLARGEDLASIERDFELRDMESHGNTLMMKIIGPIVTFVDRPWKMYPVGVLFGFGASKRPDRAKPLTPSRRLRHGL